MEDRKFIVTDAEGNEKEMYIMFTTKLEETQKSYIFYMIFILLFNIEKSFNKAFLSIGNLFWFFINF